MGKTTEIAWCDSTFNPWWGCAKVSEGCQRCYAEKWDFRCGGGHWGPESPRRLFGDKHWREPLAWNAEAEKSGVMRSVFCGSMCDILEDRPDVYASRYRAFELVESTPNLLWLFLTKRPENGLELYPLRWREKWPRNVMFGVTIENQRRLDERMPIVADFQRHFPSSSIFASCEPLLSVLDWSRPENRGSGINRNHYLQYLDWVVGGGESGGVEATPCRPEWARKLRDDCRDRDDMGRPWPLPFLWKQNGEWGWDDEIGPVYVGKKKAGRLIDGVEWNQFPRLSFGPQLPEVRP